MNDIMENFDALPLALTFTGDWVRSTTPTPNSGSYCFGSKIGLANNASSSTQVTVTVDTEKELRFYYWVSSESYCDYFRFYVGNVEVLTKSGIATGWKEFIYYLPIGTHALQWTYQKDASSIAGDDRVYIDNVSIIEPLPTLHIERFATVTTTGYLNLDGSITDNDATSGSVQFYQNKDSAVLFTFPDIKRITGVTTTWSCDYSAGIGEYSIRDSSDASVATISNQVIYSGANTEIISTFAAIATNQIKIIQTVENDYVRLVRVQIFKEADSSGVLSFTIHADTIRSVAQAEIIQVDTNRQIVGLPVPFSVHFDTIRKIATSLTHCKSITFKIAAKTLSDTFSVQTYSKVEIDQILTGSIKNGSYLFKAEETSQADGLTTVVGKYDIDDILNKGIHTLFRSSVTAANISAVSTMQAIAKALGKALHIHITDFFPADFPQNPTSKELISALFGWTDKIPQRQINVFIRGNVINVLERGRETETIEVITYANVTVSKKKIRTLQDPLDVEGTEITGTITGASPQQDSPTPITYISGIFVNGDTSITYTNGLVTKETHTVKKVEEVTTYRYSSSMPPAYLTEKNTTTAQGSTNVTYFFENEKLVKEVEKHYLGEQLDLTRITRHYPLGQGMWGTSIEENNETTYGGISQGAPGGKASPYSIANESATPSTPEVNLDPPIYTVPGQPYTKYLGTMPVTDLATMQLIANDIIWLDKKIEVRVMLDAYAETIFDLTKKIVWQGHVYYLESNTVSVTPDQTLQRLEIIRWE